MNKLLQISAGAIYTDDGDTVQFDIKNRYQVLKEVIDESSKKVLVFVPFKHTIDLLVDKLTSDGVTSEVIRGDVPASKRTEIFDRFQNDPDPESVGDPTASCGAWCYTDRCKHSCVVGADIVS